MPVKSVNATEAQKRFGQWLEQSYREPVAIRKHNREVAVLVDAEYFHTLSETRERLLAKQRNRELEKILGNNEFLEAVQRILSMSIDMEQKRRMIYAYSLLEEKRKNPISDDQFFENIEAMSDKAEKAGFAEKDLKEILNGK